MYTNLGSTNGPSFVSRVSLFLRLNSKAVFATMGFVLFVLVASSDKLHHVFGGSVSGAQLRTALRGKKPFAFFGGAFSPGYFKPEDAYATENSFHFGAVTDLDQLSRATDQKGLVFRSLLLPGLLERNPENGQYSIQFSPTRTLYSKHNEGGRGMELSELTLYNDRLLTFDDRTGNVYEILSKDGGTDSFVVPRLVITEGEGDTDKGMKWEWATPKDGYLYMGSMGKEYTNPDGSVANTNNLWIVVVNPSGEVRRQDWSKEFNFVRAALGASSPGYIINEAIMWSEYLKKWIFLPRRISSDAYDENIDERKGGTKLVLVDDAFTKAEVVDIKFNQQNPLRGFSTFAFVPGTKDRHALAIRSVEEDCVGGEEDVCKQRSYFSVFDVLTGDLLMDDVQHDLDVKFEGVEFANIFTPERPSLKGAGL